MNLYSLARKFPTEKHAHAHLIKTRWPKGVRCVACDHGKSWPIGSTNKTGGPRRLFQCASCKFQFSATTGTLFHDSHLPLSKWFAAISLMSDAKKGISASQLARHIGMTYKTAWYVAHRIREAMRETKDIQLGDPDTSVEIDETYIGGQLRHKGSKVAHATKTMVIGMAERNGRFIWSRCLIADSSPSSRCRMPNLPRTPKRLSPMAIPSIRALFPERNTREEITPRNSQRGSGRRRKQWRTRFRCSSVPSSATITSSVPGTWTATCASSAGGATGTACRHQSSTWPWQAWSTEHRYRTRRWLRSRLGVCRR
jgi:transposase-like protein